MKTLTKRLLSLALAVVMVVALLPMNALPAKAEGTLTVSAYPAKVAVGQTSQLTVKNGETVLADGLTFESSNEKVATVADGVVTGVHSGTATITVTCGEDFGTVEVEVTATSTYYFDIKAFNVGNDTNGDGKADLFGDERNEYTTTIVDDAQLNTWTDQTASKHIPFYVEGSTKHASVGTFYTYYRTRSSVNDWQLAPFGAGINAFDSFDYLNLNYTAPWTIKTNLKWGGASTDIKVDSTGILPWITTTSGGWIALILDVPAAGTYEVTVEPGNNSSYQNMDFYFAYAADTALGNDDTKYFEKLSVNGSLGTIYDDGSTDAQTLTKKFVADKAGRYYFTIGLSAAENSKARYVDLASVSLELEEWGEPVLTAGTTGLLVCGYTDLAVYQTSSFGNKRIAVEDVEYTVEGTAVELQENADGTATVAGVASGSAVVTAKYTFNGEQVTQTLAFTVGEKFEYNIKEDVFNYDSKDSTDGTLSSAMNPAITSTAPNATKVIKYTTTTANAVGDVTRFVNGTGIMLYCFNQNLNGVANPEYQNPALTAPWSWLTGEGFNSGITGAKGSYVYANSAWIYHDAVTDGSEPYTTFKLDVSSSGTYEITIDAYYKNNKDNIIFYLVPASAVTGTPDRSSLLNPDYELGVYDCGTDLTKTYTKYSAAAKDGVKLDAGSYYLVVMFDDVGTDNTTAKAYAKLSKVTLTPDVYSQAEISVDAAVSMSAGEQASISVSQTGTVSGVNDITNAVYTSSDSSVVYVNSENGVATVYAVGKGEATVTVKYTDLIGMKREETVTYTVSEAKEYKYVFSETVFNYKYDSDGDGEYETFGSDLMDNLGAYDKTAQNHIILKTSDWTTATTARYVSGENRIIIYPFNGGPGELLNPDYQNPEKTAPWTLMTGVTYRSLNSWSTNIINLDYVRFNKTTIVDGAEGYATFKLDVATSGTYNLTVNTGVTSTLNNKYYLVSANNTISARGDLINDTNYLGNIDGSAAETEATFTKYNSAAEGNGIYLEAGSYYFVAMVDDDTETCTAGTAGYLYLGSVTLTPVVSDFNGAQIQQQAVLGDSFKMNFKVTPSGSLIDGYKLFLEDQEVDTIKVENGVLSEFFVSLAANQMSRKIVLQPVDANGNPVGEAREYSLGDYLLTLINDAEDGIDDYAEKDETFAKYVYNYCAEAQRLVNKDTDRLVDVEVESTTPNQPSTEDPRTGTTEGIKSSGATLLLDNKLTLRFYFTLEEGKTMADYKFVYGPDGSYEPVVGTEGGKNYVDIKGINPQSYNLANVLTVTDLADAGTLEVNYTPMSYIERKFASEEDGSKLKNLVQALYDYHNAARVYLDTAN